MAMCVVNADLRSLQPEVRKSYLIRKLEIGAIRLTQNQFTVLIQQIRSRRRRLRREREHFKDLYFYRAFADYGDDSIITTQLTRQLIRESGQVVALMQRLIEDGDI